MEERYFIELLSAFINDTETPICTDCDWKKIIGIGNIHMIGGILYPVVMKMPPNNRPSKYVIDKLEEIYFKTITDSANRIYEEEKILSDFLKKDITCIVIKGSVIKDFYPVAELRSMGDIDIIIKERDKKSVDEVFKKNEAHITEKEKDVITYKVRNIFFEVHTKFCSESEDKPKTKDYYEHIWNHTKDYKLNQLCPDDNFHFIIIIIHLYHHFSEGGCGIRHFVDVALFMKKSKIDYEYIKDELEKLELLKFTRLVFDLCEKWFDTENIFNKTYDEETLEQVTNYILKCGVFGEKVSTTAYKSIRKSVADKKGLSKFFARIRFFLKRAFPSYKNMYNIYPVLKKVPVLLPVFWFINIFKQMKTRGKYLTKYSKEVFTNDNEANEIYELFDKLDL